MSEINKRLISAILMAGTVLGLTFIGGWAYVALVTVIALIMAWEWGCIVRKESWDAIAGLHGLLAVLSILFFELDYSVALMALVGTVSAGLLITAIIARHDENRLWSLLGLIYVILPAISLVYLRRYGDHGLTVIIFLLCIVWVTDSMAYFTGKTFGGPKLWRAVSPKKTWAGVIGGLTGSFIVALLYARFLDVSAGRLAFIAVLLAVAAIFGDLFESALKRRFSVKDSSSLIPGHGGVLDRVDGLVFASFLAAMIAVIISPQNPAGAIISTRIGL